MRGSVSADISRDNWAEATTYVEEAERLGVHSASSAEAWGYDAVTPLAYLAAKTSRIRVGGRSDGLPELSTSALRHLPRGPSDPLSLTERAVLEWRRPIRV